MVFSKVGVVHRRPGTDDHLGVLAHRDAPRRSVLLEGIGDGGGDHLGAGRRVPAELPRQLLHDHGELVVGGSVDAEVATRLGEVGLEVPGLDDDGADPEVPRLDVQRLGQGFERVLRRGVKALQRRGHRPRHRGEVDDGAGPARSHLGEDGLHHPQRAEDVGLEHPPHLGQRDELDGPADPDAGVVDEHVDRPRRGQRRGHRGVVGDVEGETRIDVDVGQGLGATGRRHHLVAALLELDGRRPPESAGASRDQCPRHARLLVLTKRFARCPDTTRAGARPYRAAVSAPSGMRRSSSMRRSSWGDRPSVVR